MSEKEENKDYYDRFLFKRRLDYLKDKKGFHTALITLMIPPTKKLFDAIGYLQNEIGESINIKDKTNRKNVLSSIRSLIEALKLYKEVPPNGLIAFSGQIPEEGRPGSEKGEIYEIEPPEQIKSFKYLCSSKFYLEPLYDMVKEKGAYGIIDIENKEAAIGYLRGTHLEILKTMTSGIHSKHSAGGQSQRRLERLIEEGAQNFYKRVGDYANEVYLELEDLRGIFVSGAGMAKQKFVKKKVLDYRLQDKVLDLVDVSYAGEAGIRETVIKIQDQITDMRYVQEKKIFQRFIKKATGKSELVTYGEKQVRRALEMGAVDTLLIVESLDFLRVSIKCDKCDYEEKKTIPPKKLKELEEQISDTSCPSCNSNQFSIASKKDLIENLADLAKLVGSKLEIFSNETEEGISLERAWAGVAAILRYKV